MSVKQISITLDNTPGQFVKVSEFLGNEGINIRAISVADQSMCCKATATLSEKRKCWQ